MKKTKQKVGSITDKHDLNSRTGIIDFESDSKPKPSKSELTQIAQLASRMVALEREIEQKEAMLTKTKLEHDRVQFEELPALMQSFGLSDFRLTDGSRVMIKPFVKASLPTDFAIARCKDPDEREALKARLIHGLAYLKKAGAGALIKRTLKADFGRESEKLSKLALDALRELGVKADLSKGVHPQTLTAWVRERLEAGKPVDMEAFAVFSGSQAKLTLPEAPAIPAEFETEW